MMLALAEAAKRPKERKEDFIGKRGWPNQDELSEHRTCQVFCGRLIMQAERRAKDEE